MEDNMKKIEEIKELFHLSDDELTIFTQVLSTPNQTIAALAKASGISRTQIYRLNESLSQKGLFKQIVDHKRIRWQAETPQQIQSIVKEKLKHLEDFQKTLTDTLASYSSPINPNTEVKFYQGKHGVSQLIWHILEAKVEIVGYTYRDIAQVTGQQFADDFYLEVVRHHLRIRDIYSDEFIDSVGGLDQAKKPSFPHPDWPKLVTSRYLPQTVLPIPHQLDIYNDTVAFYNWHQGEIFGVEIVNAKVAAFQRSLFEIAWKLSQPI
jgi:predicted transcriptional regulator